MKVVEILNGEKKMKVLVIKPIKVCSAEEMQKLADIKPNEGGVIVAKAEDCALWADEAWMGEFAKANALELKSHKFGKRNSKTLYTLTKHNL
jgi:hypothetical protein